MNIVKTVGCRLNQAEGDLLINYPFETLKKPIFIVNTCAVTQEAVRTSWKIIRRTMRDKPKKAWLIVTGCLASVERDKLMECEGIDLVLSQNEKSAFLTKLFQLGDYPYAQITRSRPLLKVQDGCNNHCSFCIACLIRGPVKSTPIRIVLQQISQLINYGYQEIVLTGLNLGCYGQDQNYSLNELLKSLPNGNYRLRLSSLQPETITDELIETLQRLMHQGRLCRHLHIPLQSGDERILQLMNRHYTIKDYCHLINKIITKIPEINIGTDIIVGFPTEDQQSFEKTVQIVNQLPFGYLHIFPYSVRHGTAAATLPDNVSRQEKKERVFQLRLLSRKKAIAYQSKFNQKYLKILAEEQNRGLSDNYLRLPLAKDKRYQKGKIYEILVGQF